MREIKFRAWDIEENEMLSDVSIENDTWDMLNEFLKHTQDELIYMQYTGLKDSSGTEIYEGDILKCRFDTLGHVFMHDGSYRLSSNQCEFDVDIHTSYDNLNSYLIEDNVLMVHSNIYENPNLLEENQ